MATFDSAGFARATLLESYTRADVELHRVDLAVPSYEARLFVNRPDADRDTPLDAGERFVGSFSVFGKVECWGDSDDHCAPPNHGRFDRRRPPNRYCKIRVRTPDGLLRRLAGEAEGDLTVNVVAVLPAREDYKDYAPEDVLRFDRLSIVTYA